MRANKPTFKWNFDGGEGSIGNLEAFRKLDPLLRCDLLKDWIEYLQDEYESSLDEMHNQWEERQKYITGLSQTP